MKKNLTESQKTKGVKYIGNATKTIARIYKQLIHFKNMDARVKIFDAYHEDVKQLKAELNESKLYLSELERKYL